MNLRMLARSLTDLRLLRAVVSMIERSRQCSLEVIPAEGSRVLLSMPELMCD